MDGKYIIILMIIGLTGTYCAGKDTVAEYLVRQKGFAHCSLSDELRRDMENRRMETTRENLIACGTELRRAEGNGVLAKRVLDRCPVGKNTVVTSIRHPGEIEVLRGRPDFYLVNVDAPAEKRFARMKRRKRPGDPETLEEFHAMEQKENQSEGPGQQLRKCRELAAYQIMNDDDDLAGLNARVESLLGELGRKRILIIDDDPDAVAALESILEDRWYRVIAARDGETGLNEARAKRPDLIILDIMMPGMDGYQVCEAIKGDPDLRHIPIIMVTARDMGDDIEMAMEKKVDWYIAKPYDIKYLVNKVSFFLEKKIARDAEQGTGTGGSI